MSLKLFHTDNVIEIGVDEAGRGPIFGDVFAGAVIWPNDLPNTIIKDSKKYKTENEREKAYDYIIDNAIAYGVGQVSAEQIDQTNIFKAVMSAMHEAIHNVYINPDHIVVDGNKFMPFVDQYGEYPSFTTVIKGDDTYISVAAGSVLAKVSHDHYINDMCEKYPILERYDLKSNKGYGTAKHMEAIKTYGVTQFHRRSFKCCADMPLVNI